MPVRLLLCVLTAAAAAAGASGSAPLAEGLYAEISTARGTVTCALDYRKVPLTVTSFVGLAEGTLGPAPRRPFFDGLKFHRVVPGYVVQGGDPTGTGEGGPGYTFADEFGAGLGHGSAGVLSMANAGPDTNGSQFFITLAPLKHLDYLYSVFGHVVSGEGVPPRIRPGDAMRVRILRVGAEARAFPADENAFRTLADRARRYGSERAPGPTAHFDDPDNLLAGGPATAMQLLMKLNNVERATGLKLYARVLRRFPGTPEPDAYTERLAHTLGLDDDGILAVYYAASDSWGLHVGSSLVAHFENAPADRTALQNQALLARTRKSFIFDAQNSQLDGRGRSATLPGFLQDPGTRTRDRVGGVLDALIHKFRDE